MRKVFLFVFVMALVMLTMATAFANGAAIEPAMRLDPLSGAGDVIIAPAKVAADPRSTGNSVALFFLGAIAFSVNAVGIIFYILSRTKEPARLARRMWPPIRAEPEAAA